MGKTRFLMIGVPAAVGCAALLMAQPDIQGPLKLGAVGETGRFQLFQAKYEVVATDKAGTRGFDETALFRIDTATGITWTYFKSINHDAKDAKDSKHTELIEGWCLVKE